MKKIAIITGYKSHIGGVETVNLLLKSILENEGHQVKILSGEEFNSKFHLNFFNRILSKIFGMPYITRLGYKGINEQFDLVICNGEFSFGIKHKNCINLFHGTAYGYYKYLKEVIRLKQKVSLFRFALLQKWGSKNKYTVAVSDFVKKILESQGIKVNLIINNSVDTDMFKPINIEKKGEIIAIGSNAYDGYAKGFDVIEKIQQEGFKVKCISNSKPYQDADWEKFVGYDELPRIYNMYKVLVFPSRFEACQMVPLEAMACGIPVVISKVGIGVELSESIPEFVCDTFNHRDYIRKINMINQNYDYYSNEAREYVLKNFSYNHFKEKWLTLVEGFENYGVED